MDANSRTLKMLWWVWELVGIDVEEAIAVMGAFPIGNHMGMKVAVILLFQSLDKGRNEVVVQFDMIWKMCGDYSNC